MLNSEQLLMLLWLYAWASPGIEGKSRDANYAAAAEKLRSAVQQCLSPELANCQVVTFSTGQSML